MRDNENGNAKGKWISPLFLLLVIVMGAFLWPFLWVEFRVRQEPGLTRLNEAVKLDSKGLAKWYLGRGCDPNGLDRYRMAPLDLAVSSEVATVLLEGGAALDDESSSFENHVYADNLPLVEAYLEKNLALIQAQMDNDEAHFGHWILSYSNSEEMVDLLLPLGVDPHIALEEVVRSRYPPSPEVMAALRKQGAGLLNQRVPGATLLHEVGTVAALEFLLDQGINVDAVATDSGWTALHSACANGVSTRVVSRLIDAGLDVSATDLQGRTPLHLVRHRNHAQCLIERGADPLARDSNGKLAVHDCDDPGTLQYLFSLDHVQQELESAARENPTVSKMLLDGELSR